MLKFCILYTLKTGREVDFVKRGRERIKRRYIEEREREKNMKKEREEIGRVVKYAK